MPENNICAITCSAPPSYGEVESPPPPAPETLMCVAQRAEGDDGVGGRGADALVERFNEGGGGGAAGAPQGPEHEPSKCWDDAVRALSTCGKAILSAKKGGPVAMILEGISCVGNVMGTAECFEKERAGRAR